MNNKIKVDNYKETYRDLILPKHELSILAEDIEAVQLLTRSEDYNKEEMYTRLTNIRNRLKYLSKNEEVF